MGETYDVQLFTTSDARLSLEIAYCILFSSLCYSLIFIAIAGLFFYTILECFFYSQVT